jgi:hypothetical protein
MVYPPHRFSSLPEPPIPEGYRLRNIRAGEEEKYLALMHKVGFAEHWTVADVQRFMRNVLPGGFFVVEHIATGDLVATAMANHSPNEQHPNAGVLDWVAARPSPSGTRDWARWLPLRWCACWYSGGIEQHLPAHR